VSIDKSGSFLQSLVVAAALGALAVIVSAACMATESVAAAAAAAELSAGPGDAVPAFSSEDPAFARVFRVRNSGGAADYAAIVDLRSAFSFVSIAVDLSRKGELVDLRIVDSQDPAKGATLDSISTSFPDAPAAIERLGGAVRDFDRSKGGDS
jgi:hypothetical protein